MHFTEEIIDDYLKNSHTLIMKITIHLEIIKELIGSIKLNHDENNYLDFRLNCEILPEIGEILEEIEYFKEVLKV